MVKINDRDLKESIAKASKKGGITIQCITGKNDEKEVKNCFICGKEINDLEEFAYLIINNSDSVSVNEKIFCTRNCWNKFFNNQKLLTRKERAYILSKITKDYPYTEVYEELSPEIDELILSIIDKIQAPQDLGRK